MFDPGFAEIYDRVLREMLREVFREHCYNSIWKIEDFLRAPQHDYQRFKIKRQFLEQEPVLSRHFSKEELEKLSLLWIAVLGTYYDSAELLVRSGADVNELCGLRVSTVYRTNSREYRQIHLNERSTILHALLQIYPCSQNKRLIRLVSDYGADLQARAFKGRNPLFFAVTKGRVQMVEMLLEKEANLQVRYFKGRTILHHALLESRVQITEMLLEKGAEANVADEQGLTPLLAAARSRKADELVPLLMKHGADVSVKDCSGKNALHYLAQARGVKRTVDLARALIEKGISLDDREQYTEYQPIHVASYAGNNELVNLYLDHHADVNARANYDQSVLYVAVRREDPAILRTLLKRGADVDQKTTWAGLTALHKACDQLSEESIKMLLSAGADVLVENSDGKTPFALMYAENLGKPGVRPMLKRLALIKVCQPSVELKDERIIDRHTELRKYYRNCIEKVESMKNARFFETCTLFELLAKRRCQIAALMRNPEFKINFDNFDLTEFSTYAEDLLGAFERAEKHHQSMLEHEDVINEAFYNILPYVVVSKVVHYMLDCCKNAKYE